MSRLKIEDEAEERVLDEVDEWADRLGRTSKIKRNRFLESLADRIRDRAGDPHGYYDEITFATARGKR